MRLVMDFITEEDRLKLPVNYNYMVQSAIYASLDAGFAGFLHDRGYDGGGRSFKLFSFSRLMGKYHVENGSISFEGKVQLVVTSPVEQFFKSILNGLLERGGLRLGASFLRLAGLEIKIPQVDGDRLRLRLLSPTVAYSTKLQPEGHKYTCYYQPGGDDFEQIVTSNLHKKYQALYQREAPNSLVTIKAVQPPRLHVMEYKSTVIKGYSGVLELRGPRELLQLALDAGLGSKNSMGFGCGEIA